MPAYALFIREDQVHNPSAMQAYERAAREAPLDPKLTPLAVYGALTSLEGEAPDGVVILQFPTVEDAKAWYQSPGYQAAIPHRKKGANYRVFIVQGL
jgi:uncharacterized protein (DUF1330 family)